MDILTEEMKRELSEKYEIDYQSFIGHYPCYWRRRSSYAHSFVGSCLSRCAASPG